MSIFSCLFNLCIEIPLVQALAFIINIFRICDEEERMMPALVVTPTAGIGEQWKAAIEQHTQNMWSVMCGNSAVCPSSHTTNYIKN